MFLGFEDTDFLSVVFYQISNNIICNSWQLYNKNSEKTDSEKVPHTQELMKQSISTLNINLSMYTNEKMKNVIHVLELNFMSKF